MCKGATASVADRSHAASTMSLFHTVAVCVTLIHYTNGIPWTEEKLYHTAVTLTQDEIRAALSHTDVEQMWQRDLRPLLVTRYPGSAGSQAVQDVTELLSAGRTVTSSVTEISQGTCFPHSTSLNSNLTLQLLFFDGEEALFQWTATDSLYGSRHLAQKMEATAHPPGAADTNQLHGIDLFVLLDLIGAPSPRFGNQFPSTTAWLSRLQHIETRLHSMSQLVDHPNSVQYFWPNHHVGHVLDDHIPFLNRGVRVLHLIPSPFPSVWHTFDDNEQNLDRSTIENLNKILQVFVLEYLSARPTVPPNPQNSP
ncbi:glutaminyl-peptide cyclotransferase [Neolamprologus brichardi]|uniref:glutaminyl-peptide cyclotransferase n=1 Tax=Neolamprologus brichardi TaxID=32507 RepID=UPI001643ED83|nr:glutaminyl-peptide cyclotransferase [Neolamprologus brichardi]